MNEKITLQDIVTQLTDKQGISKKDAELFVRNMFDLIEETLGNDKYVKVKGLGTFRLTEVDSRESINVNTGERIEIQGHTKISFTPDNTMKGLINKPFSHFETIILNDGVVLEDTPSETFEDISGEEEELSSENPIEVPQNSVEEPVQETIEEEITIEEETTMEEPSILPTEDIHATTIEEKPITDIQKETQDLSEKKKENPSPTITLKENKDESSPFLWGIIIFLVLVILLGAYWLFLKPSSEPETRKATPIHQETTAPVEVKTEEPAQDTTAMKGSPEVTTPTPVTPVPPVQVPKNERVPSIADTLEYRITGTQTTYTLQNGETIIKASLKFFGTKKFWPYIAKHNRDTFKDADNIPAGAQIKIPELAPKN